MIDTKVYMFRGTNAAYSDRTVVVILCVCSCKPPVQCAVFYNGDIHFSCVYVYNYCYPLQYTSTYQSSSWDSSTGMAIPCSEP